MRQKFSGICVLLGNASKVFWLSALLLSSLVTLSANATSPELQTPAPVIYLADNLDETKMYS